MYQSCRCTWVLKKNHESFYKYSHKTLHSIAYNSFFEKNKRPCLNQFNPKNHSKELKMPHFIPLFGFTYVTWHLLSTRNLLRSKSRVRNALATKSGKASLTFPRISPGLI